MSLRAGHGTGKGVPRIEVLAADELPPAIPGVAARPDRGPDGRFAAGNSASRLARVRPGLRGVRGIDTTSAEFRPFAAWGRRYGAHRRAELATAHGGSISSGVGALVESAALAIAASRYLHQKGSETGDADTLRRASALANDARQNELAAWELAAREAAVRPVDHRHADVDAAFARRVP